MALTSIWIDIVLHIVSGLASAIFTVFNSGADGMELN